MAETREKTLGYRRATWFIDGSSGTRVLENFIRQMDKKLDSIAAKTIHRDSGQEVVCAHVSENKGGGLLVHLTASTPGEQASTVPKSGSAAATIEVGTAAAPEDAEYMDGDAFLYVKGNDVCICTTNVRDGGIRSVLLALFIKASLSNNTQQFSLLKVASIPVVDMINQDGIKEINIKSTLYKAAASYSRRKGHAIGLLGFVSRGAKALFGNEDDVSNDSLNVALSIKLDSRMTKNLTIGQSEINKLALDIIDNQEDDDNFVLITNSGQTISQDEMYVRETLNESPN